MAHTQNSPGTRFFVTLATLLAAPLAQAEIIISEFLAINSGLTLTDEDNFPADWIEIHNTGSSAVDLAGYHLTDNANNPTKWTFPAVTLPAQGYLRVFATGKDRTSDPAFLHTNFNLNAGGEYLAIIQPDGFTVSDEFAPAYPQQYKDISFLLDRP